MHSFEKCAAFWKSHPRAHTPVFYKSCFINAEKLEALFDHLVEVLREILPGFGKHHAIDSKAITSWANHRTCGGFEKDRGTLKKLDTYVLCKPSLLNLFLCATDSSQKQTL